MQELTFLCLGNSDHIPDKHRCLRLRGKRNKLARDRSLVSDGGLLKDRGIRFEFVIGAVEATWIEGFIRGKYYKENQLIAIFCFEMFLEQLGQLRSVPPPGQKKSRIEYSGGFKNQPCPVQKLIVSTSTLAPDDNFLFSQLKIGNLRQLYLQSLPVEDNSKQKLIQQQQSIARLTEQPKKKEEIQEDQEEVKARRIAQEERFMRTYHRVQSYEDRANRMLFRAEIEKMREKLTQIVKKKTKTDSFESLITQFILQKAQKYLIKDKISNDELLLDFGNYLNELTFAEKIPVKTTIKLNELSEIAEKNLFLYGCFNLNKLPLKDDGIHHLQAVQAIVRLPNDEYFDIDWSIAEQLFHKKITVPYESQLNKQIKVVPTAVVPYDSTKDDIENLKTVFHAKPIPKTTYQRPKDRPKSVMSKTQPKPFNLTVTTSNIPKMQELYTWDRNVHATEVPQTTYKPQTIHTLTQDQKKMRALALLQASNYPPNMRYLENIAEVKLQKHQILEKKFYHDKKNHAVTKAVPNFNVIHQRQLNELEACKIQKRELTVPQPFNLSQSRAPKEPVYAIQPFLQSEESEHKVKKSQGRPAYQPASTKKFESYVNLRKKEKEQKLQKQAQKKKQALKRQNKEYKQVLKERIYCELGKNPKKPIMTQPLPGNTAKLNLQSIYIEEPLLMEREAMKNPNYGKVAEKLWQPII